MESNKLKIAYCISGHIRTWKMALENQMANFLVYAPSKLSLFQSWNVSVENLLKNSTITEKKANW